MTILQAIGWAFIVCAPAVFVAAIGYHEGFQAGHAQGLMDARQEGDE